MDNPNFVLIIATQSQILIPKGYILWGMLD